MKKRTVCCFVVLCLFAALTPVAMGTTQQYFPAIGSAAYTDSSLNQWYAYAGQCTWYAAGRAYENTSTVLSWRTSDGRLGNAKEWLDLANANGYTTGAVPQTNSIAVWKSGSYGHVAFVEAVDGDIISITEYNRISEAYSEGTINLSTKYFQYTYGGEGAYTLGSLPAGYIYLVDSGYAEPDGIAINETNFPDRVFRQYVAEHFDTDDIEGYLSEEEIAAVTAISCANKGINSLRGIEFFTSLVTLDCSDNNLTELAAWMPKLEIVDCSNNQLVSIDVANSTTIKELDCSHNQLSEAFFLYMNGNSALKKLNCSYNNFSGHQDFFWPNIQELNIAHCAALEVAFINYGGGTLTSLNVSGCTSLNTLYCAYNQLYNLEIEGCTSLENVEIQANDLYELDITGSPLLVAAVESGNKKQEIKDGYNYVVYDEKFSVDPFVRLTTGDPAIVKGLVRLKYIDENRNDLLPVQIRQFEQYEQMTIAVPDDEDNWLCDNIIAPDIEGYSVKNAVFSSSSGETRETSAETEYKISTLMYTGHYNGAFSWSYAQQRYVGGTLREQTSGSFSGELTVIYTYTKDNMESPDGIAINEANFPDQIFRQYVANRFDTDGDGYLNDAEVAAVTYIDCWYQDIASLKGIEFFISLTHLQVTGNSLSSLDVTNNTELVYLSVSANDLTSLDLSQNSELTWLDCCENPITDIDISSNQKLAHLFSYYTDIATIDITANPMLIEIVSAGSPTVWGSNSDILQYDPYKGEQSRIRIDKNTKFIFDSCICAVIDPSCMLTLPAALTSVSEEAFWGISAQSIIIPSTVESIASKAFANCPNLEVLFFQGDPSIFASDMIGTNKNVTIYCTMDSSVYAWARNLGLPIVGRRAS